MPAQRLASFLGRHRIHYAWVIVAVTFVIALTTAGAVGIPGALILPMSREFGWDTAEISGALAVRLLLFGLMAPFAAHQLGAATAAFGAGLARTLLDSYIPAFYLAGAACLLASLLVLAARPGSREPVSPARLGKAAT